MTLQWYGQACFKITSRWIPSGSPQSEEIVFVIDPFDKKIGLRPPGGKADVVLITHDHFDHNNAAALSGDPILISGPGEYDLKNVFIRGIEAFHDAKEGKERGKVTLYVLEMEDLRICHLGDFGQNELREDQLNEIGDIDILLIPVGGVYTIDGEQAQKIIHQVEPSIVIPMHYYVPGLSVKIDKADGFLKIMGAKNLEATERFTIKKKDINPEETRVVVMTIG